MTIGIDARLYGTKHGGIGRYISKLIEHLEIIDTTNHYFIFLQKENFDSYQPKNNNFKKILADYPVYSWREQFNFALLTHQYKLDLMHFTHFSAPLLYRGKYIVTIHDLIISHYPDSRATTLNPIFYKIKLWLYNVVVKRVAKKAQQVIAVSHFTKNDVVKLLGVEAKKIVVIYEGVSLPSKVDIDCSVVLKKFNIKGDYLLYVGSAYPHKNLDRLLEVVKKSGDSGLLLVLAGKKNFFYHRLETLVAEMGLSQKVILTDYVSDDELACLYRGATAYVFPSLIEGFGLPALEAQSYNLPVISSNTACLPEVLSDSAIYFNPTDTTHMAKAINEVILSQEIRQDLIDKGEANWKRYSWLDCANQTHKLYHDFD